MLIWARGDWFFILLTAIAAFFMARPYIYTIQQDNYRIAEIYKSKRMKNIYLCDLLSILVFGGIWAGCYFIQSRIFWGFLIAMFFMIAEIALYFIEDIPDKKKPLRYTKRTVRAFISVVAASSVIMLLGLMLFNGKIQDHYLRYALFFGYVFLFPVIFMMIIAVVNVAERMNNRRYERRTRTLLERRDDLIKIAITGSFGKTSVKNMLYAMLSKKYSVLVTPDSYNTPMGISLSLKGLDATHEVFIAEMGARRVGDIKKLMRIVQPEFSILTGINNQHMQTFKTQENITAEKCKVVTMARKGGVCVVGDKLFGLPQLSSASDISLIYAGLDETSEIKCFDIAACETGSIFAIDFGDGEAYQCVTPLLGKHNIENIALAAAMAFKLGVDPVDIVSAIRSLEPVPHRLQLICGNGIRIIDDSFNGNPDGARGALEVLGMFSGRKIAITPGLVELGEVEREENYILGTEIAAVADIAMLIGKKRTEAIRKGLSESDFKGEVYIYSSLKEAETDFDRILRLDDVLLILNDLPDVYDE